MERMTEDSQDFSKEEEYPCIPLYHFRLSFSKFYFTFRTQSPLYSKLLFRTSLHTPFRDNTVQSHQTLCAL
jgi:hypothetical protein